MKKRILIMLVCLGLVACMSACNFEDFEFGGLVGELLHGSDLQGSQNMPHPDVEGGWIDQPESDILVGDGSITLQPGVYYGQTLTMLGENSIDLGLEYSESSFAEIASYKRNAVVQDMYGIKIRCVQEISSQLADKVVGDVNAGIGEYDIVMAGIATAGTRLVQNNMLYDLSQLPYVDLTASCWDQGVREGLAFGTYLPMLTGEILPNSDLKTAAVVFNTVLAEQNALDLYDYVQTGGWTLFKMSAIVQDSFNDLNGNSKIDIEDALGLVAEYPSADAFAVAARVTLVQKDDENLPVAKKKVNDRMTTAYEIIREMITDAGTCYYSMTDMPVYPDAAMLVFEMGNTLLYTADVEMAYRLGQSELQVGMIPYPKYDEAQESYHSYVDWTSTALMVSTAVKDTEFVGYALEAMSQAYASRSLLKDYICRSARDAEMMDIILATKTPDFAACYDTSGQAFYIRTALEIDTDDISSLVSERGLTLERNLRKLRTQLN